MFMLNYNKNFFKKFTKIYNYKLFIYISNKNFYCYLLSFFKFNVILNLSTVSRILKNYIIINFGKFINYKIFNFIGKCFLDIFVNLKLNKLKIKILNKFYFKKLNLFFKYLNKYLFILN